MSAQKQGEPIQPVEQPGPAYTGADGKPHDDGLHDAMLDNADADRFVTGQAVLRALRAGVPPETVRAAYVAAK